MSEYFLYGTHIINRQNIIKINNKQIQTEQSFIAPIDNYFLYTTAQNKRRSIYDELIVISVSEPEEDTCSSPTPTPAPTGSCCGWSCDYLADIIWPEIEDPQDIPDISDSMIAAGWVFIDGLGWVKTVTGEVDCDDPQSVTVKAAELEDEVDAIVVGEGGFSEVSLVPEFSGLFCADDITQEECEQTYSGTWRPGVSCSDEPCYETLPEPTPTPTPTPTPEP
jgi:hypothetical protein